MKSKECVFCDVAKGKKVGNNEIIMEGDNFLALKDTNQRIKGHLLVIPKKHYVTLLDIPNKLRNELLTFTKKVCSYVLDKKMGNGFDIEMNNLEVAGQVIMHAHIHILPRNEGDGLKPIE